MKSKAENQNRKMPDPAGLILPAVLLICWYLATAGGKIPGYLLPAPKTFFRVFWDFAAGGKGLSPYSGQMAANMGASVLRVAAGFGIAAVSGLSLGFMTGRVRIIRRMADPVVHLLRAVPGIGWLPLAMVWFGIGEKTTFFLIALAAFFPIYLNTAYGAASVPPDLLRAGAMLGAGRGALFATVVLPAAFPSVAVGLRLGLGVAWAYLVLGELTGVSLGLGAVMMDSRMLGQTEMIPIAMICIAVLGKISDRLLLAGCRIFGPGNPKHL